jgi:hypothetical protein
MAVIRAPVRSAQMSSNCVRSPWSAPTSVIERPPATLSTSITSSAL